MAKKTINDPVFGELEYNEKGYWIRKISLSMWGVDEEIDLIVKCGTKEEIIDDQRNAYRYYLESLKKIEESIPDILFSYYNDHYEDIARERDVEDDEELRKDSVSKLVVLDYSDIKSLFIDRNGNYGWLVKFIWNDYPISVILSEENIKIYEGWNILKENYIKADDPVFGELEYNEKKGYWTKKILLGMWRGSNFELDLMVKCSKEEEITDAQRDAYNTYLTRRKRLENEIPAALLSYYKDHFEDIERVRNIDEELKIDTVDEKVMLKGLGIKSLFIDRNGNYGWLINFIWKDNPFSVILSDDKIRIYERWGVLVDNYTKVNDEVFGEMVNDRFTWKKLVKKDLFGVKGKWITVAVPSFDDISQEQRTRYLEYKEKEDDFIDKIPNALMTYYMENYNGFSSWWNVPPKNNRQNINMDSLMELVTFHRLYFHMDGKRYGWLCGCEWDKVHGLSFYYDGENDEMQVGWQEDLFD